MYKKLRENWILRNGNVYSNKVCLADFHLSRKFAFLIFPDNKMSDRRDSFFLRVCTRNFPTQKIQEEIAFFQLNPIFPSSFPFLQIQIFYFLIIESIHLNKYERRKLRVIGNDC